MGVPKLNRYLLEKCRSSIKKTHLSEFSGTKLAIDTSIYLYKYIGQEKLIENFYLMINLFKYYNITPIFVFDGKPPPEKKELLQLRKLNKREAETKYNEMKEKLSDSQLEPIDAKEINLEMDKLKKQFIRLKESDINVIKTLIIYSGSQYYEAEGEADVICASMVIHGDVDACLSDDMDLCIYGCNKIYRYMSLLNHNVVAYDMNKIIKDLDVSLIEFKQVLILSGTDYNINQKISIQQSMNYLQKYKKSDSKNFFNWLVENNIVSDSLSLESIYSLFEINSKIYSDLCYESKENKNKLSEFLKPHGFIFI